MWPVGRDLSPNRPVLAHVGPCGHDAAGPKPGCQRGTETARRARAGKRSASGGQRIAGGSHPVQKYPRSGRPRCRNTPGLPVAGAEMPHVWGAWGRLCGTFLPSGECYAASVRVAERAQFLVPSRTRRVRVFGPVPNAAVLAAKTAAGMPLGRFRWSFAPGNGWPAEARPLYERRMSARIRFFPEGRADLPQPAPASGPTKG